MTSYGNLLFTVGITVQLLLRHGTAGDVIGDVIVSTRYGRVRGRRVHMDYGLGPGLICIHLHIFLCLQGSNENVDFAMTQTTYSLHDVYIEAKSALSIVWTYCNCDFSVLFNALR